MGSLPQGSHTTPMSNPGPMGGYGSYPPLNYPAVNRIYIPTYPPTPRVLEVTDPKAPSI